MEFIVSRVSGQEANTFFYKAIKEGNSLSIEHKNIKYENKFEEKVKQELIEVVKKNGDCKFERIV